MTAPIVIFFASIFTNNILLANYLGMCPFISVSRQLKASAGLGGAVIFVITCTTAINYLVYHYVLTPFGLTHLQYIAFIVVIAAFVQFVEMVIDRVSPALYYTLGIFLPLITVNCAILGVNLFAIIRDYDFIRSVAFGAGSGVGWTMAILALGGIRERMEKAPVPETLFGSAQAFIIVGIMDRVLQGMEFVRRFGLQLRLPMRSATSPTPWSPVEKFFMRASLYFRWMYNP